jgi:chaperone modulatory protein CbpM
MMRLRSVVAMFDGLGEAELVAWVERRWVQPGEDPAGPVFAEVDVARVRLIHDLRHGLDVPEDTLPLVLSLLDQVHALRGTLSAVAAAMEGQPPEVRAALGAALERRRG